MKKKKRGNKSILLRIMILGVCTYMLFTFADLWKTWSESTAELNELRTRYSEEENDIEELRALLAEDSNTGLIEKAARERLGYVYPDEQIFIDISGN